MPEPSTTRIGSYEIVSKMGQGAMGIVYRARSVDRNKTVALKVLYPRLARNASFVKRLQRESRAASMLKHENIVQGIDFGEADGYHYFAMEFVEGKTLQQVLRSEGPMEEMRALRIARQVASALTHAKKSGILHRDIKPSNILLAEGDVAKLADLGLAKELRLDDVDSDAAARRDSFSSTVRFYQAAGGGEGTLTQMGAALGTPFYMSPEQARGEDVDGRSDIYALGATLCHMLSGSPPHRGETLLEILRSCIDGDPPDVREARPEVSRAASRLIRAMLAKAPGERPQSPATVVEALDEILEGRAAEPAVEEVPLAAEPESLPDPPEPPAEAAAYASPIPAPVPKATASTARAPVRRRRRALLAVPSSGSTGGRVAILACLLALAALLIVVRPWDQPSDEPPRTASNPGVPPPRTRPPIGPGNPARAPREPSPGELLASANAYRAEHPGDYEGCLERYRKVAGRAGAPEAEKAKQAVSEIEALRKAEEGARREADEKLAADLLRQAEEPWKARQYGKAREALAKAAALMPAAGRDRLAALQGKVEADAGAFEKGVLDEADRLAGAGKLDEALRLLATLKGQGTDPALLSERETRFQDQKRKASDWKRDEAEAAARRFREKRAALAWDVFQLVRDEEKKARRFQEAESKIRALHLATPEAPFRAILDGDLEAVRAVRDLEARIPQRLRTLVGKPDPFSRDGGRIQEVSGTGYRIAVGDAGGGRFRSFHDLSLEDLVVLFRISGAISPGDAGCVEAGGYHLFFGNVRESAAAEFSKISDPARRQRCLDQIPGAIVFSSLLDGRLAEKAGDAEGVRACLAAIDARKASPETAVVKREVDALRSRLAGLASRPAPPDEPAPPGKKPPPAVGPPPGAAPPAGTGFAVTNLRAASGKAYATAPAESGAAPYIDRPAYTLQDLPPELAGSTLIRTSYMDSEKGKSGGVEFQVSAPARLIVAFDRNAVKLPGWIQEYRDTGQTVTFRRPFGGSNGKMGLYARDVPAGRVAMGAGGEVGKPTMYFVFVLPAGSSAAVPPPATGKGKARPAEDPHHLTAEEATRKWAADAAEAKRKWDEAQEEEARKRAEDVRRMRRDSEPKNPGSNWEKGKGRGWGGHDGD